MYGGSVSYHCELREEAQMIADAANLFIDRNGADHETFDDILPICWEINTALCERLNYSNIPL